MTGIEVSAM